MPMRSLVDEILEKSPRVQRQKQPHRPLKTPRIKSVEFLDWGDELLPLTRFAKVTDSNITILRQMINRGVLKKHFFRGSTRTLYSTKELANFINAYYS